MANVLFTWELGMGLGHIAKIKSLAKHFIDDGHTVFIALRDLKHSYAVFSDLPVTLLQTPISHSRASIQPIACYSQLLTANGFEHKDELIGLCLAWQALFDLIKVDVLLFEHSPVALLAGRGVDAIKAHIGTGFTIPPCASPFAHFQPEQLDQPTKQALIEHESQTLHTCNQVLMQLDKPLLDTLGNLYGDVTFSGFLSLPEFDHFGARDNGQYLGLTKHQGRQIKPAWPQTSGKKIFIYLKSFEHLETLLKELTNTKASIIFYSNDINTNRFKPYHAPNIHYEIQALDLELIAQQADLAITNANHATLMHFILNEVPVMMIPLHWEQQLMALRMQAQGVGVLARKDQPQQLIQGLQSILNVQGCSNSVKKLAKKYKNFDAEKKQKHFCHQLIQDIRK